MKNPRFRGWARRGVIACGLLLFASALVPANPRPFRTWTSADGATIEARLKEARDGNVVIVRKDGKEFTAPIARFSAADRAYVAQQVQSSLPSARTFAAIDFSEVDLPVRHQIDGVPHVGHRSKEAAGAAAVKMVLDFHGVEHGSDLYEIFKSIEDRVANLIPATGLQNALKNLPLDTEMIRATTTEPRESGGNRQFDSQAWNERVNAMKQAIHWGLPVVVFYRTEEDVDTPAVSGVAVGYDRQRLQLLDPQGSRSPVPLDIRDLEARFVYGLVVFPHVEAVAETSSGPEIGPDRQFLSQLFSETRGAPSFTPEGVAAHLQSRGLSAAIRDINPGENIQSISRTRSFARVAGLQLLDQALAAGQVVLVPQEFDGEGNQGFVLIFGRDEKQYQAVELFADRQFRHGALERMEVARRWLGRHEDRSYRLDLIEVRHTPSL